jgi:glycosyltransferase involved in cell wall biosynthesis
MEKLVKHADAVTVDTSFLQQRFGGVYLPNGKDTCLFNPANFDEEASRIRYGLGGLRVLMFPGAPRPHKGLEDVLMALDRLNDPDYRLVIVGENPYDNYDESLISRWGRWIVKLPAMPVDEMPAVVAAAHVVVVPQRDELTAVAQFPIKLSEGMAMAKPVLATRVGDIPAILGETGFLVDAGQPDQIATTLEAIFQDLEQAKRQGAMARARCIERYSLDAMAEILSGVLLSVLL